MRSSNAWSWLLGTPGRQRTVVKMILLQSLLWVALAALELWAVHLGYYEPVAARWHITFYLGGSIVFYGLARSGWSARLSPQDPALTLWHMVLGIVAMIWSYAIGGPVRGSILTVMVLILTYGMFSLPARQTRRLGLGALAGLALVMVYLSQTQPQTHPPGLEFLNWMMAAIVVLGTSELAKRMSRMRERLSQQKQELSSSLAQNQRLATLDELTGLVNRRHMSTLIRIERERHLATGLPLSVALLDIDHFKQINDSLGHQTGDLVLQAFSAAMQSAVRGSDVVSRWGGEEFLLLFPQASVAQARQILERMQSTVAQIEWPEEVAGLRVTFSAGLVLCAPHHSTDQAVELADQALYRAKQSGRNRICSP